MNAGFQREIRHGMMISADYVRNVETHGLLGVDVNHAGAARYFNRNGALNANISNQQSFRMRDWQLIPHRSTAPIAAAAPQLETMPAMV